MFLLQRSLWLSDTSLRGSALPNLKIQLFSQSFYVYLRKQEELNSWILRLGKAGLVISQTGVMQTSANFFVRVTRAAVRCLIYLCKY